VCGRREGKGEDRLKGKEKERDCDNIKSTRLYFSQKILLLSIISDIFEELK